MTLQPSAGIHTPDQQGDVVAELLDRLGGAATRPDVRTVLEPRLLEAYLKDALGSNDVIVTNTAERRLVLARKEAAWHLADLSGVPLGANAWPDWFSSGISIDDSSTHISSATLSDQTLHNLSYPRILFAALYHPEYFPLPRFPLGISDLARAARSQLCGHVDLQDMQLGDTVESISRSAVSGAYDLVGISATFGQHDLQLSVLDHIYDEPNPPLVVAGGSLTVRNERDLLDRYPNLLIARGAGEDTVQDLIHHLRGEMPRGQVRGIGYVGSAFGSGTFSLGYRKTGVVANRDRSDFLPELDLLHKTFEKQGVAQLEGSRGCTNYCSFCPRGHKGSWSGGVSESFDWIVHAMGRVFDLAPDIRRTVYMVDEEFIGRGPDTVDRALGMAQSLHGAGMTWETSCRVDQIVHQTEGPEWHLERAQMWRDLRRRGLKRCLFGIESGVTSILERFNKETTGEQNALAIRTLSALGVPTRFTYITFDQLMSYEELRATADFQGRRDLVLRPLDHLSVEDIVAGVRDEAFVHKHSLDAPFYRSISYMLVSMECLIGAAYTKRAQAAGLTGKTTPSMGRVESRFADWRIGEMSHHAQLWVDRSFALDYTMKSIEKIAVGDAYEAIRETRRVLKDSGFALLQSMIASGDGCLAESDPTFAQTLLDLMDNQFDRTLRPSMDRAVEIALPQLPPHNAKTLESQYLSWASSQGWHLINAGDNCD